MSSSDPGSERRVIRLLVLPLCLFVALSGAAFALAKLHLAKPSVPKAGGPVALGDSYSGEVVFTQKCSGCHGEGGKGGSGPKLAGASISLAAAKAQIDGGGSTMPAQLVSGQQERDVLAYLATILGRP